MGEEVSDPADILNRVITSVPIDATAGRVTSKGETWEPKRKIANRHWEAPPPMRAIDWKVVDKNSFQDFSGRRVGRLTVLGLLEGGHGQWVVRCDCGDYESRKTKAIKNPLNDKDRCDKCMHLVYIRRARVFKANGTVGPDEGY